MSDTVDPVVTIEGMTEVVTEVVVETVSAQEIIEVIQTESLSASDTVVEVVDVMTTEIITDTSPVIEVIAEVMQGPQGPAGTSEEDMAYAKRLDMVSESLMYKGEAAPGSADTDSVWRIRRVVVTMVGELVDTEEKWVNGDASFIHKWSDRETLTYL